MRPIYVLSAGLLTAIAVAMFAFSGFRQARDRQPPAIETLQGTVVDLPAGGRGEGNGSGAGMQGPAPPLITLRTATETIKVHAGPPRFHEKIGLILTPDDRLEITGTREGKGRKAVMVARTVKKGDQMFAIRGENGEKLWKPTPEVPPALTAVAGEVVSLAPEVTDTVPERTRSGMLVAIRTAEGTMAIQLGPESFRIGQGLTLAVGDRVEVSGWLLRGAVVVGNPVLLAASIRRGDQELRIRDEQRRALWTTN